MPCRGGNNRCSGLANRGGTRASQQLEMPAILHVDMDAFYASVEVRDNPSLAGKPVVVGGTPEGRGVVSAASYEARKYGVHSAMSAVRAHRLCPHATFLRPRMRVYVEISGHIRKIFNRYTPLVEPLSLDEAFLDVTASERLFGSGVEIARRIRADIRGELQLVASVGVAPNKFLAKLASDLRKPDALVVVPHDAVQAFLDPLPVGRLWGVGAAARKRLEARGIYTIAELREQSPESLGTLFGRWGEQLWRLAHGIDGRAVVPDHEAKSISHETTFAEDVDDRDALRHRHRDLLDQVARRLRRHGLKAQTVELKLRYGDFTTVTRSRTLPAPTDVTTELWASATQLLEEQLARRADPVRLLGTGVSGLGAEGKRQADLFEQPKAERGAKLDGVLDAISGRFGAGSVSLGGASAAPRRTSTGRDSSEAE
ncbi:MAG: DNA polymerase IV [Gammaproteobacteria bacterium]